MLQVLVSISIVQLNVIFRYIVFQCHLPEKLVLLKFLGHLWCKNLHQGGESGLALLQVQCLHIATACLGSISGKAVKELAKTTCSGTIVFLLQVTKQKFELPVIRL